MKFIKAALVAVSFLASTVAVAQEGKAVSVTPSINIINFPHPLDGSVEFVFDQFVGVKLSKSLEPKFTYDGNRAHFDDKSIAARIYPTRGSWFLGLAYGEHEINARRNQQVDTIYGSTDVNIYANVKAQYLTPMTGWKWVSQNGFTVGLEVGWVFPFHSSSSVTSDQDNNPLVTATDEYRDARSDANNFVSDLAGRGIPNIGLLELGWTF